MTRGISADAARVRVLRYGVQIARLVANQPMTLRQIALACGLSERSVRRYLVALQAIGIDVHQVESLELAGRWRLDRTAWIAALDLPADREVA